MSEQLKNRTKKFALDVVLLCAGFPYVIETRHAIGQVIRSSSSVAANYRSACRGKSKADFISKLGTVEEEADESGFWLEMLRDIADLRHLKMKLRLRKNLRVYSTNRINSSRSLCHPERRQKETMVDW